MPSIGLGTWSTFDVGTNISKRDELSKVLETLTGIGGKMVDTSPMYGSSESVVGDLSSRLNLRNSLFLATKVWIRGKEEGIRQMRLSFQRLKTEVIDLMQVHNLVDVDVHLVTLRKWKEAGTIKYYGVTHYTVSAYLSLIKILKSEELDFVQFNYNIMVRDAEKYLLPLSMEKEVAVIINRPFEEGLLFERVKRKPLPEWAKEYHIHSWSQYFLKYILSHPAVTCVIPATGKVKHLEDNLISGEGSLLNEQARRKMAAYFDSL